MKQFWLMKSEPDTYSFDDLKRDRTTAWEGVRNYMARNHLRAMRTGDRAFFYNSAVAPLAIVGIMEIVKAAYPDPAQFDRQSDYFDPGSKRDAPRWDAVDVRYLEPVSPPITREAMKAAPGLKNLRLFSHTRLSVSPVTPAEWKTILGLEHA
jgi:predicted RNA-binding protein with PUA-like domain